MNKHVVTLLALALAGLVLGSGGLAAAATGGGSGSAAEEQAYVPHPKTIVRVTGDKKNGFEVFHFDGSADFPPTDSEAKAECREYRTRVARVKCRTEVRDGFRMLAELRRSINYQRSLLKG